ncbi:MAG: hypothetical protein ACK44M_09675, partial [Chloroflexus sp.]
MDRAGDSEQRVELRANRLRIIDTVAESTTKLIANRQAWADPWKREKLQNLAVLLQGALLAESKVGLKMNVPECKIDQVLGRDFEVRQVVDILTRRRQNNPILVGEAGVGKTAVVEGFARRIVDGDVPPPLRNVRLLSLDLAMLQAGAG